MNKILICVDGVKLEHTIQWLGLILEPEGNGIAVTFPMSMERKRRQRMVSILRGYLSLLKERNGAALFVLAEENLPRGIGKDALFVVWFDRARHAERRDHFLRLCYNAFGALPGGYPMANDAMCRYIGPDLTEKYRVYLENCRRDEGDLVGCARSDNASLSWYKVELDAIYRGLIRAWEETWNRK